MRRILRLAVIFGFGWACLARPSLAGLPEPLGDEAFTFPSSVAGPPSALSAGRGLADRWLGEEPFGNPAAPFEGRVSISPAVLRMSRQDLRAGNRRFDERPAFLDIAGGSLGAWLGSFSVSVYGYQPVVRREDNAFERGDLGQPTPPAVIQTTTTAREMRAGVAVSHGAGFLRLGVAGEWTRREDAYLLSEESGSPDQGHRRIAFRGDGVGFQVGARAEFPETRAGALSLGVGVRYLPALSLAGRQWLTSLVRDTLGSVAAEREAGWEGGLSARLAVTEAFHVIAGLGGGTAREWKGLAVESGTRVMWAVAGEFRDARDPWSLRLGIGRERHNGVAESRAGIIGLGIGWDLEGTRLELGVLRRSLDRSDRPTSFDDRAVASVSVTL